MKIKKGTTVVIKDYKDVSFKLAQDMDLKIGDKFIQFKNVFEVVEIHPVFIIKEILT